MLRYKVVTSNIKNNFDIIVKVDIAYEIGDEIFLHSGRMEKKELYSQYYAKDFEEAKSWLIKHNIKKIEELQEKILKAKIDLDISKSYTEKEVFEEKEYNLLEGEK